MRVSGATSACCIGRLSRVLPAMLVAVVAASATGGMAQAQSLTPMRGEVRSTTDRFAIRVFPGNPYNQRIKIEVKVYDETFREVPALVTPREALLSPQDSRGVMVMVPFEGYSERRIRICAESVPFNDTTTRMRAQVCGKFLAQRLQ